MNAIILIGGLGTRLRPLTLHTPKALMPILNRPFLTHQLDLLKKANVRHVMLSAGRHTRPWEQALKRLAPRGMRLSFCYEPYPLGTGGGIRYAYDRLREKDPVNRSSVLVFNGDILMELDVATLVRFHLKKKSEGTIVLVEVADASRYGLIRTLAGGLITQFIEKPAFRVVRPWINAGAYLLEPRLLEQIPSGRVVSIERESFPFFLKKRMKMFGFRMGGYWNDIGTHATYLNAHGDLLRKRRQPALQKGKGTTFSSSPAIKGKSLFGDRVRVGASAVLEGFVCCGSGVKIGDHVTLSNSIIMEGASIGDHVRIAEAIIGPRCRVESHAHVRPGTVLGEGSLVSAFSTC